MSVSIWWLPVAFCFGGLIGTLVLGLCKAASDADDLMLLP